MSPPKHPKKNQKTQKDEKNEENKNEKNSHYENSSDHDQKETQKVISDLQEICSFDLKISKLSDRLKTLLTDLDLHQSEKSITQIKGRLDVIIFTVEQLDKKVS